MIRFAVQCLEGEGEDQVAEAVVRASARLAIPYKFLETVDWLTFGSTKMLIFGADLKETKTLLEDLSTQGRGYVRMEWPNYIVVLGGRKTPLPSSKMLMARRLKKVFRGPSDAFWERQFS